MPDTNMPMLFADLGHSTDLNGGTYTPLGASQTFDLPWADVSSSAFFDVAIKSDVSSSVDGCKFQWSHDGVTIFRSEDINFIGSSQGRLFALTPRAKWFRIQYVNGATPQTVFEIHVVRHLSGTGLISRPLDQPLTDDNFAQTVRAALAGRKSDGTFINLQATNDGKLGIETTPAPSSVQTVDIQDGEGSGEKAQVLGRRLHVALAAPEAPSGTVAINQIAVGLVTGASFIDDVYIIPNGKTATIQNFSGGAEASTGNSDGASKIELFYDPSGIGVRMTLIRVSYSANSNFDFALNRSFVGDGIRAIRMRRTRLDSGNREIAAFWDGYRTP